jgi:hypothetical protein
VKAESEAARVIAIKELLDRGYGKAMQPIQGTAKQMIDSPANPIGPRIVPAGTPQGSILGYISVE